ncbi:DUF397 domain-containing protein [Actinomadura logoneensis]|uniref:DUF397 domain-containing protein n=1 Tax=Actinomadura logoneensis TaxID=2293572 RepID=A0A372JK18_9ACTN|nr:DUF397 domain-containing protein [Actinomadura logoneensis]RFU40269.1 DUF397 domain-containing protein [Actinomadura logoneensis]
MDSTTSGKVAWRKGSRCGANGGCVEVGALAAGLVGARDSHLGDTGPVLRLSAAEWRTVRTRIQETELDLPS